MMAPVMVWVVLTGRRVGAMKMAQRGGGLGGESVDRLQLGDLRAHRIDDAPAAGHGAEPDGRRPRG